MVVVVQQARRVRTCQIRFHLCFAFRPVFKCFFLRLFCDWICLRHAAQEDHQEGQCGSRRRCLRCVEAIARDLLSWNISSLPLEGESLANTFVILERLLRLATDILFNLEVNSMAVFHVVFLKETPYLDVRQYLHVCHYEQLFAFLQIHIMLVSSVPNQEVYRTPARENVSQCGDYLEERSE